MIIDDTYPSAAAHGLLGCHSASRRTRRAAVRSGRPVTLHLSLMKRLLPLVVIVSTAALSIAQDTAPNRDRLAKEMYAARMEYAKTKEYSPYDTRSRDAVKKVNDLYAKHDFKAVLKEADAGLQYDRFNIDLLMAKAAAYRELKDVKSADDARGTWMAVVDSILNNGDGRSFKTAWTVINVSEEYAVLSLLECEVQQQSLQGDGNSRYDVLNVSHGKTGRSLTFYFNVDAPMKHLHEVFSGDDVKLKSPNKLPLPTPPSITPAAGAPITPPPGAGGR
jgi:Domain of unknown function (DUF4919)